MQRQPPQPHATTAAAEPAQTTATLDAANSERSSAAAAHATAAAAPTIPLHPAASYLKESEFAAGGGGASVGSRGGAFKRPTPLSGHLEMKEQAQLQQMQQIQHVQQQMEQMQMQPVMQQQHQHPMMQQMQPQPQPPPQSHKPHSHTPPRGERRRMSHSEQGGGVTSNPRTKPNPLLQYAMAPGSSFPPHPSMMGARQPQQMAMSQQMHMAQGAAAGGSGGAGGSMSMPPMMHMRQASMPHTFPPLEPKRQQAEFHYARRQRRSAEASSLSMPVSRLPTPTHAAMMQQQPPLLLQPASILEAPIATPPGGAPAPGGVGGVHQFAASGPLLQAPRPSTAPGARSVGQLETSAGAPVAPPNSPTRGEEQAAGETQHEQAKA